MLLSLHRPPKELEVMVLNFLQQTGRDLTKAGQLEKEEWEILLCFSFEKTRDI